MEGKLICGDCGHEYMIKEGIANFLLPSHLGLNLVLHFFQAPTDLIILQFKNFWIDNCGHPCT